MANPKVTVSVPKSLKTTASERSQLKSAFRTKILQVVKPHSASPGNDITNVGRVVTQVVVVDGAAARKRGSKRKAGKKAGKKK